VTIFSSSIWLSWELASPVLSEGPAVHQIVIVVTLADWHILPITPESTTPEHILPASRLWAGTPSSLGLAGFWIIQSQSSHSVLKARLDPQRSVVVGLLLWEGLSCLFPNRHKFFLPTLHKPKINAISLIITNMSNQPRIPNPFIDFTLSSILPVPHLCQERRHIDLLGLHLRHPRVLQHPPRRRPSWGLLLQTTLDEVFEHVAPLDAVISLVF